MGRCVNHSSVNLFELQRQYSKGLLNVPSWQRGDVWTPRKKDDFKRTVLTKAEKGQDILTGCIIIYTTQTDPHKKLISDGLQRTLNSRKIFEDLKRERGETESENILSCISVPVLNMEYCDDEEAKTEFRIVNQGTPLTPLEEAKTILAALSGFEQWKDRVFAPLHIVFQRLFSVFGIKEKTTRNKQHMYQRDNFAIFLRYITKDKTPSSVNFDISGINDPEDRELILEQKIVNAFSSIGIDEVQKEVDQFRKFIESETVIVEKVWSETDKASWASNIQTLTEACVRWLMCLAVYRRNNQIPIDKHTLFVRAFLRAAKGTSIVRFDDGGYIVIGRSNLSRLPRLQQKLGVFIDDSTGMAVRRKKTNCSQTKLGYHNAHIAPFSKHGNGPTVPIPALENLSNGVLPIPTLHKDDK